MTIAEPAITVSASEKAERCPWCDQPISHQKFEEIQARIKAEEQQRSRQLSDRLRAEFEKEKAERAANAKADLERVKEESAAKLAQAKAEAETREKTARAEAKKAAEAASAERVAKAEEAKKLAEEKLGLAKAEQEEEFKKQLAEHREALEKSKSEAVNEEKAKAFESQQKLRTKLEQVQRQLERRTAEELGEGAEIDSYETLRTEFPEDRLKRIDKGAPGADIWHDIWHNDQEFGRIVYDSKNRSQWRNSFVSKLRADQHAAKAEHAVLATRVFPSGERQLCIRDGVIVTNPARVVELVRLLREHAIQVQRLRLSNEERKKKMAALYDFLSSERCSQLLDRVETLSDKMLELEVKEKKAHDRTWNTRGTLIRSLQKVHGDFRHEADQIIEHGEAS